MAVLCHTEYSAQKKAQLANGLLSLMMQSSYQDISVTDICREVNIPRRTFYHYYENKEDVLETVIESMMQPCFLEGLLDLRLGEVYIEQSLVRMFRFWDEDNRKKLDALIRNGLESRLITWSNKWIQQEQLTSLQRSQADPKLVEIGLMVGITDFFSLLFYWSRGGYQESPEQMAKYAVWVLPHAFYQSNEAAQDRQKR